MKRIAYYPGSFDPITNGHIDVLRQSLVLADEVIVAIGVHPGKTPMFTLEERASLIREITMEFGEDLAKKVSVEPFDNLVVDAAVSAGATILIRGVRDSTDLNYEMQMSGMNGEMEGGLTTVFLPATPKTRHITATLVRQIAKMGGDVSHFVPPSVNTALKSKLKQ